MKYKNFTLKFDRSLCSFIVLKTLKRHTDQNKNKSCIQENYDVKSQLLFSISQHQDYQCQAIPVLWEWNIVQQRRVILRVGF